MDELEETLKRQFGYASFRPGQRQIIELVLSGQDALILMPTGGGKSLTYQLPALHLQGLTIVISPLIALMKDQVERLQANGIAATFINSMLGAIERERREQAVLKGKIKLLYLAPERLMMGNFLALLDQVHRYIGLSLLAVDEAHCVSEWGHDFRPEYRQLGQLRERYSQVPMLALTATATERVRQDILQQLRLQDPYIYISSFNRPNLNYEVRQKQKGSFQELVEILKQQPGDSTIIYCQSRKSVESLSEQLNAQRIQSLPYHAGLSDEERNENQERFIRDDVSVLVATVAFGMGIGKPDVRNVIHYDMPKSLEGYYQESGRAGRDGQPANCIFFFSHGDRTKLEFILTQKIDEQEERIARQQMQQVIAYAESSVCRRRILLGYFGETLSDASCGNCDNCLNPRVIEDRTIDAQKFLSCVSRTKQRFGMRYIVDILRGANTQKIRSMGHDQLSTYGIGKDLSVEDWLYLGRALIHQGLLNETTDGFPILHLNSYSVEILKRERSVEVARPARARQTVQAASGPVLDLSDEEQGLLSVLRNLRKRLADERSVPPYVIFHDSTLRALARQRPHTQGQFARIPGVGSRKLEEYGELFVQTIVKHCEKYQLGPGQVEVEEKVVRAGSVQAQEKEPPTRQVSLQMYRQGYSVDEIADLRGLKAQTIVLHLVDLFEKGEPIEIEQLVAPERFHIIAQIVEEIGDEQLKPIKERLGEEYGYDEIYVVRAVLRHGH